VVEGSSKKHLVVHDLKTFLDASRKSTTQWRRTMRIDSHTEDGKITLARLVSIFSGHGIIITDFTKQQITNAFGVPGSSGLTPLVERLNKVVPFDEIYSKYALKLSDLNKAMLNQQQNTKRFEDISKRRAEVMTSIMRKNKPTMTQTTAGGTEALESLEKDSIDDTLFVIDFNNLCDNIYVTEWL
jgi:hypothetical protein